VAGDRHSVAEQLDLITDPKEKARREAENGLRQFNLAVEIIRDHVKEAEKPFRLRSSTILRLHKEALDGIHLLAGTFRNTAVKIGGSGHQPVDAFLVPEETEHLCEYVNDNWDTGSALHLGAYVLWRVNWIHPFADGNGRTARTVSYVVLSIKLDGLLPGVPTIPDQIASDKNPYYEALEVADEAWKKTGKIDVSKLETMIGAMLAKQLLFAAQEAAAGKT
jgi:Fic family protein